MLLPPPSIVIPFANSKKIRYNNVIYVGMQPTIAARDDGKMLCKFINYINENNLTEQVVFQVGHFTAEGGPTVELEVVGPESVIHGTVTRLASMVNVKEIVPTGYNVKQYMNQPTDADPPAGQTWAKKVDESHKVFINKPAGAGPGSSWTLSVPMALSRQLSYVHVGFWYTWFAVMGISWTSSTMGCKCDTFSHRN
jgi:hypothetical protein